MWGCAGVHIQFSPGEPLMGYSIHVPDASSTFLQCALSDSSIPRDSFDFSPLRWVFAPAELPWSLEFLGIFRPWFAQMGNSLRWRCAGLDSRRREWLRHYSSAFKNEKGSSFFRCLTILTSANHGFPASQGMMPQFRSPLFWIQNFSFVL